MVRPQVLEKVLPYRDESLGFLAQVVNSQTAAASAGAGQQAAAAMMDFVSAAAAASAAGGGAATCTASPPLPYYAPSPDAVAAAPSVPRVSGGDDRNGTGAKARAGAGAGAGGHGSRASSPGLGAGGGGGSFSSGGGGGADITALLLSLCPRPDGTCPEITAAAVEALKRVNGEHFRELWKQLVLQVGG